MEFVIYMYATCIKEVRSEKPKSQSDIKTDFNRLWSLGYVELQVKIKVL